jgi:phage-related protein
MTDNEVTIVVKSRDASGPGLDAANKRVAELKARIRDLGRQKIEIDANIDKAQAALATLRAELKSGTGRARIEVEADIAAAENKIEELRLKAREIGRERATLQIDTDEAQSKIQAAKAALREVDGKTARADVDVDIGAAMSKLGLLMAAILATTAAAGAIGGAVGIGAIIGAGIGAAVAGLAGIGDAVKALGEQNKGAGAAAGQAASQHLTMASAIDRVRSAQAGLANTAARAADSERQAAQRVTQAQQDLTRARADAARALKDLARQQEDMALAQRGAALDVRQAKEDLDRTLADPKATALQREQARLTFDEAVQHNKELAEQAKTLAAAKTDADKRGVAGAEQVVTAQQRVKDASEAVGEVQRQNAYQLAQAQQQVVEAQRAVQAASIAAGAAGAASMDKLDEAMANLGPSGQKFAVFLRGFIDGPVKQLRAATQDGLLPGIQEGLAGLGPVITGNLPAVKTFSTVLGNALGGVLDLVGQLAPPFLKLATVALRALAPLKGVFDGFADAFGKMVDQITKDGSLQAAMSGVVDLFGALLMALPVLLPPLIRIAGAVLPLLAKVLTWVVEVVAKVVDWLGQRLPDAISGASSGFRVAADFIKDHVLPAFRAIGDWISDHVMPALRAVGKFIVDYVLPAMRKLYEAVIEGLVSAFHSVSDAIGDHRKELGDLGKAFVAIIKFILEKVVPIIGKQLKLAFEISGKIIGAVIRVIAFLVRSFEAIWHAGGNVVHAMDNVGHAFGNVGRAVKGAYDVVTTWFGAMLRFVGGLPGKIGAAAAGMWDGIKNAFKGAINWIIDGWNGIQLKLPDFPGWVVAGHTIIPSFTGPTLGMPHINRLAHGGIGGGLAIVGERGRELVRLPQGSTVIPNGTTENMLAGTGGGGTLKVELEWAGGNANDDFMVFLRKNIRIRGGNVQAVLGGG